MADSTGATAPGEPKLRRMVHGSARSLSLRLVLLLGATTGCGGERNGTADDGDGEAADGSGAPAAFALTSSAFGDGGRIPVRHTCSGIDVSPPLAWSGRPAAGFALVLTDRTDGQVHSVLWDVGGDVSSLPEAVEEVAEPSVPAGSKQALAIDEKTRGYFGPCPAEQHTYEFALHALDEHPLAGVTLDSARDELAALLAQRAAATAVLSGTFETSGW